MLISPENSHVGRNSRGTAVRGPTDRPALTAGETEAVAKFDVPLTEPSVSVVMPALNEARNLPHVFATMPADVHEIILVDGHSVDDTATVAQRLWPEVRLVRQTRVGKGNALACGFAAATGDIIAMVDADGSADPGELSRFIAALRAGADFAKGTRFVPGGGSGDITRLRKLGNRGLSAMFNRIYGTKYTDLCYGYNAFWRRHLDVLGLDAHTPASDGDAGQIWGDGFEVETLIHVRIAKSGLVVAEVPSFEHPRLHGVSNLNAPRDGLRVLRTIVEERRLSRRKMTSTVAAPLPAAAAASASDCVPASQQS
jgi:glycosyltransferase involved in cell wall biosynthesis